jgi:hypothetical protein
MTNGYIASVTLFKSWKFWTGQMNRGKEIILFFASL